MYAIETCNLKKVYRGRPVVDGFSMHVPRGAIYGFVGCNGAGKSTVMKMIDGLAAPTAGEIRLFGGEGDGGSIRVEATHPSSRQRIGALIESPGLIPAMSVWDNLMAKALALGVADAPARCREMLDLVGLAEARSKAAKRCSQGMKQRLGIGLALIGSPDLLLLDEPFNGLDPEGTQAMRRMLMRLNEMFGITLVISSHVLDQLDRMATHYGVIVEGTLVREMTAAQVREDCGDSLVVRTTDPELTLAQLEQAFPDGRFRMEADRSLRLTGSFDPAAVAEALRGIDATVLELTEIRRDIEDYFVELMEGGASHV